MAKKKPPKVDKWGDASTVDTFITEQFRAMALKNALPFTTAAEAASADIGLRLPHLCWRYFFQRSTYPLERVMLLVGPPGSNKTSLLYWFYKLFRQAGGTRIGRYFHIETEDKDTPELRMSIVGYDDPHAGFDVPCKSLNEAQSNVAHVLSWYQEECQRADGPGSRSPIVIGFDSLTAKMTEEAAEVVDDNDGVTGRRFADEARSLNDWFKYIPTRLQGLPTALIAINHDKPKPGLYANMPQVHHSPGGVAPNYYATYRILMERKGGPLEEKPDGTRGNRIKFSLEKSSLGPDKQKFEAEISWRMVDGLARTGKPIRYQITDWNWAKATTELLYELATRKEPGQAGEAIEKLLKLRRLQKGWYTAAGIGIKEENTLSPTHLGEYLETLPDVLAQLEPALGVRASREFRTDTDFQVQIAEARKAYEDVIPVSVVSAISDDEALDAAVTDVEMATPDEPSAPGEEAA